MYIYALLVSAASPCLTINDNNYNAYYYKLFQKADTLLRLRLYHPMRQRYGVPNNISFFCCKLCAEWTLLGL